MTKKEVFHSENKGSDPSVSLNFTTEKKALHLSLLTWVSQRYFMVASLLLMLTILYVVFIILPGSVESTTVIDSEKFIREEINKPIDVSPWQEAQLAKNRKAAQAILSEVMEKQQLLEDKTVKTWAEDAFSQAIAQAESGDVQYRAQEFEAALQSYQQALQQLQAIESSIDSAFSLHFQQGQQALADLNQNKALAQLRIAFYIKPESEQAQLALRRSEVLNQVLLHIDQGIVFMADHELTLAKEEFGHANNLDSHSPLVQKHLLAVDHAIVEKNYSLAMSKGYFLLNKNDYQAAISAFGQAKKIKPTVNDPKKAILEAKNKQLQARIANKSQQAKQYELAESWQEAQQLYQEILILDNSLMKARIGEIRTGSRYQLDQALLTIINKPQRLTNENVYQQSQSVFNDAQNIKQPGKKLSEQITQVSHLLKQLTIPVALTITSDNLTKITLYRIGELGRFANKQVKLKPGQYTLLGSRDGYRDVRQQVTLMPNSNVKTIEVSCIEKVSNG